MARARRRWIVRWCGWTSIWARTCRCPPQRRGSSVAISPDGTRLVYASGTPTKLFMRRLDQPKATELPGTQGAAAPFFSPDGQWVGFVAGGKVNKISVEGGAVVPLGTRPASSARAGARTAASSSAREEACCGFPMAEARAETVAELRDGELALVESADSARRQSDPVCGRQPGAAWTRPPSRS